MHFKLDENSISFIKNKFIKVSLIKFKHLMN